MSISIKNRRIEQLLASGALDTLSSPAAKDKLPVVTTFQLGKLLRAFRREAEVYIEAKQALIDRYVEKDEQGKFIMFNEREAKLIDPEGYRREVQELAEQETVINLDPVKINLNKLLPGIFSAEDMAQLSEELVEFV